MSYNVTLIGQTFPDFNLTFSISDTITDTDAVLGLAVCQDTAAANTVKLATDGSEILGRIFVVEDGASQGEGVVATIERVGGMKLPVATGETIAVGDEVVGAAGGKVRKKTESDDAKGLKVWEVGSDFVVVLM